jgi:competence protein ComEC
MYLDRNYIIVFFWLTTIITFLLLYFTFPSSRSLEVVFLDVGQGDSIFITTVTGKQVLIDGGKYPELDKKISKYMNFYDRRIDIVIATHPDLDHIGGLNYIIDNYEIDIFLHPGLRSKNVIYEQITSRIKNLSIKKRQVFSGSFIQLDEFTRIEFLLPYTDFDSANTNEYSVVGILKYAETSVILTGDSTIYNEVDLVSVYGKGLHSNLLKLGHHGSNTSSSDTFIESVNPKYAVVSAACDNNYNHPHPDVINRINRLNIELHETCGGDVSFISNGRKWRVLKER